MAERIVGRLQTPADNSGRRYDIHPITSADAVMYDDEYTVKDMIGNMQIKMSSTKPAHPGLWLQPLKYEDAEGNMILKQLPQDPTDGSLVVDENNDAVILDASKIVISEEQPTSLADREKIWAQPVDV